MKRKNRSTIRKIVIISKRSNRHHSDQPINVRLTKIQKCLFKKSNFSSRGTLPFLTSTKKTTNWSCGWTVITTLIIFFFQITQKIERSIFYDIATSKILVNSCPFLRFLNDLFSEQNYLGLRNVTFRLFFNNYHLRFCCQIITHGHHLSKNIIASQFSQFSFFCSIWHFEPYFGYMT